jgi:polysaccharide export outer membrane protein
MGLAEEVSLLSGSGPVLAERRFFCGLGLLLLAPLALGACSTLGASGPGTKAINSAEHDTSGIKVLDVTPTIARHQVEARRQPAFAEALGDGPSIGSIVAQGDVLDISIWEAPPAALFGTAVGSDEITAGMGAKGTFEMPQQMVDRDGLVMVPFVGPLKVSGLSPVEVSRLIVSRLRGRAHLPQAIVRITENQTANVTVFGDVTSSKRMPLTAKSERILDALAAAGGVKQPVDKMTIQVTRGNQVVREPLSQLIREPRDNIRLAANDVVTALYQPYSFQALGALGSNADINFEGTGLTLAQALARVGGLQDSRSNVKGVFIFRMEDPAMLPPGVAQGLPLSPDGRVAVIYRIDLSNPATLFVAQQFPIADKDVLYVSNAPLVDIQKFVAIASQLAFSIVGVTNSF